MSLAILIAMSAAGITAIARTVAQDHGKAEWLLEKPLSCDLCMSFWGSFSSVVVWAMGHEIGFTEGLVTTAAGVGGALVLTKAANRLGA
jgi:hypothetical protein